MDENRAPLLTEVQAHDVVDWMVRRAEIIHHRHYLPRPEPTREALERLAHAERQLRYMEEYYLWRQAHGFHPTTAQWERFHRWQLLLSIRADMPRLLPLG